MILRTSGLSKAYGARTVLSDVDMTVAGGSVYGLVGPNGAGKTTLLSILAGLRRASAGSVQLDVPRSRVALLPDTPQFEPWLTGREVVSLAGRLAAVAVGDRAIDATAAVERTVADAGLADRADDPVGAYSRGMLQRLGLAATLVGQPEVLLLDEPASALDPAGRRDVLDLIRGLRGRATVLLSSHILADVQEVCDTIGILRAGRLLYQGPLEALLIGRAVPAYRAHLRPPLEPVQRILRSQPWVTDVLDSGPDELRILINSRSEAERQLAPVLGAAGARVVSLVPEEPDLEDVFLELTDEPVAS
jgi:ABC-2 type transport system ATP-binding protein